MATAPTNLTDAASIKPEQRIGFAKLTKLAFDGVSLLPMFNDLTAKVDAGTATAGDGMDLSLITQLLGERETGLAIQNEVLAFHQLYRSPCASRIAATAGAGAGRVDRHGRQYPDRFPAAGVRYRTDHPVCGARHRAAVAAAPSTTSPS